VKIVNGLLAIAFFAFVCPRAYADRPSPKELVAYKQVESLYARNALEEAEKEVANFYSHYPQSTLTPLLQNIQGLLFLRKKKTNDAVLNFRSAVQGLSPPKEINQRVFQSILFNLAIAYFENSQLEMSAQTVSQVKLELLDTANQVKVSALKMRLRQIKDKVEAHSNSIGVLLPLTGKFASYGMKSLQALQLAFEVFSSQKNLPKLNLIVEDSGDQTEQILLALNRLALKHRVVAIIGPMLTKGIDEVSKRAEELQVPLLSLARRSPSTSFEYVLQAGLTQQLQAYEIARHAIQNLGMKKFAIVYPNDKLGAELGNSFWDAAETLGGSIVGVEFYAPGQTDFKTVVEKLAGLYYSDARQRELDLLAKDRETNKIIRRTKKNEAFYQLKPIVDFEAVFVADNSEVAGQLLPTFAYRDIETIKFLGTSAWNSPEFIARTQSYGENSLLVDAYLPGGKSSQASQFTEKYKNTFGQDPTTLEALAYDAGRLLWYIASKSSNYNTISRAGLLTELQSVKNFSGVTGEITYKNGQLFRPMKLIQVKNGQFVEQAGSLNASQHASY
jgi:branched-chain amino acid transport system substrate-binding protein